MRRILCSSMHVVRVLVFSPMACGGSSDQQSAITTGGALALGGNLNGGQTNEGGVNSGGTTHAETIGGGESGGAGATGGSVSTGGATAGGNAGTSTTGGTTGIWGTASPGDPAWVRSCQTERLSQCSACVDRDCVICTYGTAVERAAAGLTCDPAQYSQYCSCNTYNVCPICT